MNVWEVKFAWKYVGIPASESDERCLVAAVTMEEAQRKVKAIRVTDYKDKRFVRFTSSVMLGPLIS